MTHCIAKVSEKALESYLLEYRGKLPTGKRLRNKQSKPMRSCLPKGLEEPPLPGSDCLVLEKPWVPEW